MTPKANSSSTARPVATVRVKPVANAIAILRHLACADTPLRAADVARQLAINTSTCFNILRTLVAEGVVDFDPHSKMYGSSLGLASLVGQVVSQGQRLQKCLPVMQEFAVQYRATVTLWKREGDERLVLVASESSPNDIHINMPTGQRLPILMGASGRLLAHDLGLTRAELREAFLRLRWADALSFEAFEQEAAEARARGWSIDDGHFSPGAVALAVPIADAGGKIAYTAVVVMFRGMHTGAETQAIGSALCGLGRALATILV